jgi:glyoxylase-like metal-dependent hydrolase (beta-lactamase superfamily II)
MELLIEIIKNKPIDSNCFVFYNNSSSDCIIVDPGTEDCEELLAFLAQNNLDPKYILLTHEHFDHIWGVNKLLDLFTCKVVCSEKCLEYIADKKKNLSVFYNQTGFEIIPSNVNIVLNNTLEFGGYTIQFKETLGHSLGSVSFWVNDMFFGGDVLIKDAKTVTKLPGGCKKQLIDTLNGLNELFSQRNMVVYPGHGEIFRFNEINFKNSL